MPEKSYLATAEEKRLQISNMNTIKDKKEDMNECLDEDHENKTR